MCRLTGATLLPQRSSKQKETLLPIPHAPFSSSTARDKACCLKDRTRRFGGVYRAYHVYHVNDFFFNLPNPSSPTKALGYTQPLTEMSTKRRKIMFLGSRARPVLRADNLATFYEPTV
jgi:hypothetical protein